MSDTNYDPEAVICEQIEVMEQAYTQLYLIQLTNHKQAIRKGTIDSSPSLRRLRDVINEHRLLHSMKPIS